MHPVSHRLKAGLAALVLVAGFLAAACGDAEEGDGGETPVETETTQAEGDGY